MNDIREILWSERVWEEVAFSPHDFFAGSVFSQESLDSFGIIENLLGMELAQLLANMGGQVFPETPEKTVVVLREVKSLDFVRNTSRKGLEEAFCGETNAV